MFKYIFLAMILLATTNPSAEAKCIGDPSTHDGFCKGNDKVTCKMHPVCKWKQEQGNKLKIQGGDKKIEVSIDNSPKICKGSPSAHDDFCKDFNESDCNIHAVCKWDF